MNSYFRRQNQKLEFMENDLFRNKYRIPSARAYWHDYNCGYYFITICTEKREHYFGEIYDKKMCFSQLGRYTDSYINKMNSSLQDSDILSYVVMPNHIHLIIAVYKTKKKYQDFIKNETDFNETMSYISRKCGRLSNIILKLKSGITRYALKKEIPFKWQERFHDRIIRDNNEFEIKDNYIKNNISNWKDDEYYPTVPL